MKCPNCDGTGNIANGMWLCCECQGTGFIEDEKPSEPMTNEEMLRGYTFEELAGAIYEWHTKGYTRGRLEADLNPITEVVEWLKQPHDNILKL